VKVLIVEDDPEARLILTKYLTSRGYEAVEAEDGPRALEAFHREELDALLLDLMIPPPDGWEVLQYVRGQSSIPIVVITARDATDDVVKALQMGADDYIVKPFKLREVEARLEAALRRHRPPALKVGPLEIDDQRKEVRLHGKRVELSPKEYELLKLLASEPGRVFSDREILERVWPEGSLASSTDVKRYIHLLRRKVEEDPKHPKLILTVKGFGYALGVR